MIQSLLEYAESRGLASRPGYRKKSVKWVLQFDASGKTLTGVLPSAKEFQVAPDLSFSELRALGAKTGEAAHFLVAPLGTFLGWAKDADPAKQSAAERKEATRRGTLIGMLSEGGRSCPNLSSLADALADEQNRQTALTDIGQMTPAPKPTDAATVRIGTMFPVEDSEWHAWWDTFRATLAKDAKGGGKMISFASGDLVEPESTHPKLTKLTGVGLSQPFAPIITFDKPAFESYGLEQCANAAMDAEAAKAYTTAIDDLLERSIIYAWRRPKPKERKRLEQDFARLGGARLIYWYTGPTEARRQVEEEFDFIGMELSGIPPRMEPPEDESLERALIESRIRGAIERIRSADSPAPLGQVRFCLIALSGAGGRVMVRDFVQGSVLQLAEATDRWFTDLKLHTWNGWPGKDPELERILTAPLRPKRDQDYQKWIAPVGAWRQQIWRAALLGNLIPQSAAAKALLAFNSTVVSGDLTDPEKGPMAQGLARFRLALVKAYLIRTRGIHMTSALAPEHRCSAYHCGRLLAVYDDLQRAALGEVGAGVIQRYYGGALTNPSGVFGQLSRMAQTHLNKLEGLAGYFVWLIAEIHDGIRKEGDRDPAYPSALSLDDQGLFALGFWHQTAFDNSVHGLKVEERKARLQALSATPNLEDQS